MLGYLNQSAVDVPLQVPVLVTEAERLREEEAAAAERLREEEAAAEEEAKRLRVQHEAAKEAESLRVQQALQVAERLRKEEAAAEEPKKLREDEAVKQASVTTPLPLVRPEVSNRAVSPILRRLGASCLSLLQPVHLTSRHNPVRDRSQAAENQHESGRERKQIKRQAAQKLTHQQRQQRGALNEHLLAKIKSRLRSKGATESADDPQLDRSTNQQPAADWEIDVAQAEQEVARRTCICDLVDEAYATDGSVALPVACVESAGASMLPPAAQQPQPLDTIDARRQNMVCDLRVHTDQNGCSRHQVCFCITAWHGAFILP